MSLNRRHFIHGVLTSAVGTTAMVRLATPAEAQFVQDEPVILAPAPAPIPQPSTLSNYPRYLVTVHNATGACIVMGEAVNFEVRHQLNDLSRFTVDGILTHTDFSTLQPPRR